MVDGKHNSEDSKEDFDPNAQTVDDANEDKKWLKSNVHAKEDEWIGQTIGQFLIVRIIGTGGMGNVYEAEQSHPRRAVALKIVKSAAASPSTLQRFELESEMLARLQHPNIAQVYDSGHHMHNGTQLPYFAMEYVPGSLSITDYSENEGLSIKNRLALFLRVCDAVQYGHGRGVIHRDLKPSNLLITKAGRPKVIDFGVALMAGNDEADHLITKHGRFVGTLQWSSPEQCGDDPHDVDVRTDVYSLGVVLYQLIVGQLPYDLKGIPIHQAPKIVQESLPKSIDSNIASELGHILDKALKKDRDSRYGSVADFSLDIRRFLNNQPIQAKPATLVQRLRLYAKRNQLKFRAAIAVAIAIMVGLAGLVWGFIESEAKQKQMEQLLSSAAVARNIAEHKAYVATIGTVQAAVANKSWDMARNHLFDTVRENRGWEWNYLKGIVDQSMRQWLIGDRPTILVTSIDGQHFAVAFDGGRILLVDEVRQISRDFQLQSNVQSLVFSLDGANLLVGLSDGTLGKLNLEDEILSFYSVSTNSIESIAALDAGGYATGHANGDIQIWNELNERVLLHESDSGMVLSLGFDLMRSRLAIGSVDGSVQVLNIKNMNKKPVFLGSHDGAVHDVEFLENGNVVSGGADDQLMHWDINQGLLIDSVIAHRGDVMNLVRGEEFIATAGEDGVINLWAINPIRKVKTLRGHSDAIWSLCSANNKLVSMSRDGSIRWWNGGQDISQTFQASSLMPASDIAFVWNSILVAVSEFDHRVQIVDLETGEQKHIESSSKNQISKVVFIPTTSNILTGDVKGEVRLWDAERLQFSAKVGTCDGQISTLAVSPFGRLVAVGTYSGEVRVWDIETRNLVQHLNLESGFPLALSFGSTDEILYASASNGVLIAYDLKRGITKWHLIGTGSDVVAMDYDLTHDYIITATASNVVQLLDGETGALIASNDGSGGGLRDIAVFPDGSRFATVRSDGTIGIWTINNLGLVASIPSSQALESIDVSSDGHFVAISGGNGTIQVLNGMMRGARGTN